MNDSFVYIKMPVKTKNKVLSFEKINLSNQIRSVKCSFYSKSLNLLVYGESNNVYLSKKRKALILLINPKNGKIKGK